MAGSGISSSAHDSQGDKRRHSTKLNFRHVQNFRRKHRLQYFKAAVQDGWEGCSRSRGRGFARKEVIEMVDKLNEMTKWPEVEVAVSRKCNNK